MNKLKTTKYMYICTNIGYVLGFGLIFYYILTQKNAALPFIGVIIIFLGRTIGYGIDRIIELKQEKKRINNELIVFIFFSFNYDNYSN